MALSFYKRLQIRLNPISLKHRLNFFRLLSTSLNAGLGVKQALDSISKSETQKGIKLVLKEVTKDIEQGRSLSYGLKKFDFIFPSEEIALISAAESIGSLPEILNQIADELERYWKIKQKIKKALAYPIIVVLVAIIAVIILSVYVLPTIIGIFPDSTQLPHLTQLVMNFSTFIRQNWYWVLGGLFFGFISLKLIYSYFFPIKLVVDSLLLYVPVVGSVIRTFYMYRFSKLLGQFYSAGVSPIVALKHIAKVFQNLAYKKKVFDVRRDLKNGFSFFEAMQGSKLFDPILVQIIHVGEDTGELASILLKVSYYYHNTLDGKIGVLVSLLEPFMILFLAVVVGVIVAAVFLPLVNVVNLVK